MDGRQRGEKSHVCGYTYARINVYARVYSVQTLYEHIYMHWECKDRCRRPLDVENEVHLGARRGPRLGLY